MNLGNIPGFYYDEEKKKYFKIQATHKVPQDAKYSVASVKQERRKAKKQKTEHRKQALLHQQTIKRSAVLQNSITGGIGLAREHGSHLTSRNLESSDAAIISQWRPHRVKVSLPDTATCPDINMSGAQYLPSTGQMLTASTHLHTGASAVHVCQWDWDRNLFKVPTGCGLMAFHSGMKSISTLEIPEMGITRLLVCSTRTGEPSSIFMGSVPSHFDRAEDGNDSHFHGFYLRASHDYGSLLSSCIYPTTGLATILGSRMVAILNSDANQVGSLRLQGDEEEELGPSIDWFNSNVVAYSYNSMEKQANNVMLWDVRTKEGTSARFHLRGRITGVQTHGADKSIPGNQLLVSTNHNINLFDTRMTHYTDKNDASLLSFQHVHQGPELDITTNGQSLVAAVDRGNVVQIYSLRTGRRLTCLENPDWRLSGSESRMIKKLQWYEDEAGSALQACLGNGIVRWVWSGPNGDL